MSERDGYEPGVPCWVDTWQPDGAAAAGFYAGLFGWETTATTPDDADRRYFMCRLRGRDVAAIGSPQPSQDAPVAWTTYVWVHDVDACAASALEAGGTVVAEPSPALDGGRIAVIADPAGAVLGLWQPGSHRGAQIVNEPSAWAMSMLQTPDLAGSRSFYGAVFGWQTEEFAGATMWRLPGYVGGEPQQPVPRDVVATMIEASGDPAWTPDFWVGDADAVSARAAQGGGAVIVPPSPSPVGKSAVLADPAGAVFSISQLVLPG